ncbi:MAG: putative diguanylate cyclase YegE [Firmicutes bacterium]|nr:putative diguanylate cyclase YegE [candidate division NPL-UPA2 bacterium]
MDFFGLFNNHGAVMLVIDAETGAIVFANQAAHTYYGFPGTSLVPMNIAKINTLSPEEVARERQAAAREERNFFVFRHRLHSGEIRTVEVRSYPVRLQGETYLYSIVTDISDQLALEAAHTRNTRLTIAMLGFVLLVLGIAGVVLLKSAKREAFHRKLFEQSERKYRGMIANVPGMVYRCKFDRQWTMEFLSQGCADLTGYEPSELLGNAVIDFNSIIHPDYREFLWEKWQLVASQGGTFNAEYRIVTKGNREKWVWEQGYIVYGKNGQVEALDGLIMDISRQKETQLLLQKNEAKLWATLVSVGDGVITTDAYGKVEFLNPTAEQLTGWSAADAVGEPFTRVFTILREHDRATADDPVQQVFATQSVAALPDNTMLVSRNGGERAISDSAAPIKDSSGAVVGVVVVFKDCSLEKARQREIEYISFRDYLTGLYNRRFYEEELRRLDTPRNLPLAIIMADVNALKTINDAFGHEAGDEMLSKIGAVLKRECRADDIVARIGGDEFVVLLPRTSEQAAAALALRIAEKVRQEVVCDIPVSVSLGWAAKTEDSEPAADTLKRAEDLLYRKKVVENINTRNQIIHLILQTLLDRSPAEAIHAERVRELSGNLADALQLSPREVQDASRAGEVHDIGKIACSQHVLLRTSPLTDAERTELRRHPETGYRVLSTSTEFASVADGVLSHHERWDGTGYPKGLCGEDIPLLARIIAVADAYADMVSPRPYRPAREHRAAVEELVRCSGSQFDPEIVRCFVEKVIVSFE